MGKGAEGFALVSGGAGLRGGWAEWFHEGWKKMEVHED